MATKKTKEPTKELTKEQTEARQKELAAKIRTAPISEIAHKLKQCSDDGGKRCTDARFAIFLGAGASLQANIKTAGQMMADFREEIIKRACPDITDKKKQEQWLKKNILDKGEGNEYSKLFEAFERTRAGRQKYISKLIKDKIPTFGYAMLASIIARGFINTILTTNFDDLMFIACNKFTGVRPVIYAYGIMATEMKFSSPHSKILKMHGDYLYSALANTEREMSLYNQDPNMKAQVAHALNEYELIVFGYSGSDDSVMDILENYPDGKELYWCHWSGELPSLRALELLHAKDGTLAAIEGFDDAMYDIYKVVDFELDEVLASYEERRNEIRRFIDIFREKYPNTIIEESIPELEEENKQKHKGELSTWFEYFEEANLAKKNNDFSLSEKYYQKAIELNPSFANAFNNFGNLLKDENRLQEAEENYRKAIELSPISAKPYRNLGLLLARDESRQVEAEENYRKAIELNQDFFDVYNDFGNLLAKDEGRQEEAEENYRKAIELNQAFVTAYRNLGDLLAKNKDRWEEAEKYYRKAIEINPTFASAYRNLGVLLAKDESRQEEAEKNYRKALELNQGFAEAYNSLGNLLAKDEGRQEEAEENYRKAIELNSSYTFPYRNLGDLIAKDENRRKEAEKYYRKAIELDRNFADAYNSLGILLAKDERYWNEAEKNYRKAIELNPTSEFPYKNLGRLFYSQSKFDEAKNAFLKSAGLDENNASICLCLTRVYKKQNDHNSSVEYAKQSKILIKKDDYYNLACLNSLLDDKDESFRNLILAINKHSRYKSMARTDPDFEWIRDDERFWEIVGRDDEK